MKCFDNPEKYTLHKKIAEGGFSKVYYATQEDNVYALKIMKKNHSSSSYENECVILSSLHHSCICKFVEDMEYYSRKAIVLEYIDGMELYEILYIKGSLSYLETLFIGACILSALIYLHDLQIIYRDIKPENIIINNKGYGILVDFGFAKKIQNTTSTFCGTIQYMAPEMKARKSYSFPVDMYAFGILLYEIYTQHFPFEKTFKLPKEMSEIIQNLLLSEHERKTAFAVRWSNYFNDIDFEKLEKKELISPYKP